MPEAVPSGSRPFPAVAESVGHVGAFGQLFRAKPGMARRGARRHQAAREAARSWPKIDQAIRKALLGGGC
eukprot:15479939-Alexandrium_andersonii.AAC.1